MPSCMATRVARLPLPAMSRISCGAGSSVIGADTATVTTTWTPDNKPGSLVQVQVQCNYAPISSLLVGNWTLKSSSKG
jgi:hypothetical protein